MPNENVDDGKLSEGEWKERFNQGGWTSVLPDELLKDPSIGKFSKGGVDQVVKSYLELQKGYGDKVPKPKATYKKDEWDNWNKSYNEGYPESPDNYDLTVPDMPEEHPFDLENDEKMYRELAYKYGLTTSQAQGLWKEVKGRQLEAYKTQLTSLENMKKTDKEKLSKEWGSATDEKLKLARSVLTKFGTENVLNMAKDTHVGADVWIMLANIGEEFKEGTLEVESSSTSVRTPTDTKMKIAELTASKAYMDQKHSMHGETVRQVTDLFRELNKHQETARG